MILRIKAKFDGQNLIPIGKVDLPPGAVVEIEITSSVTSVHRKSDPDMQRSAQKSENAAQATLRMPKTDLPVETRIAKRSSDEVTSSS